jgi:hypothetical protein
VPPFVSDDMAELKALVNQATLPPSALDSAPPSLKTLVTELLARNPAHRLDWRGMCAAPFLEGELDNVECTASVAHAAVVIAENAVKDKNTTATNPPPTHRSPNPHRRNECTGMTPSNTSSTPKAKRSLLPRPSDRVHVPPEKGRVHVPPADTPLSLTVPSLEDSRPRTAESILPTKPRTPLGNTYTVADMSVLDSTPTRRTKKAPPITLADLTEVESPATTSASPLRGWSASSRRHSSNGGHGNAPSPHHSPKRRVGGGTGEEPISSSPGPKRRVTNPGKLKGGDETAATADQVRVSSGIV